MGTKKIFIIVCCTTLLFGCKKLDIETIEYQKIIPDDIYNGFSNEFIITHANDFSYFNPDSNKVFGELYEYINEQTIGSRIIDFEMSYSNGFFATEDHSIRKINTRSFVNSNVEYDVNDMSDLYYNDFSNYLFVSSGKESGIVYKFDISENTTSYTEVGIYPTKMAFYDKYLYVINSGDSTMSVINAHNFKTENTIHFNFYPLNIISDNENLDQIWMIGIKNDNDKGVYIINYNLIYNNSVYEFKISEKTFLKKYVFLFNWNEIYCLIDEGLFLINNIIYGEPVVSHLITGDFDYFDVDDDNQKLYFIKSFGENKNGSLYIYDSNNYNLIDSISIDPEPLKISSYY